MVGKASDRKTLLNHHEMWTQRNRDHARAFPRSDAQRDRRDAVTNGLRLPYQEWVQLKKIALRRRERCQAETRRKVVIGMLNVGRMTNRGMKVVDLMERKGMDILCVQETRWKGAKAREMGNGYKLYYVDEDGKNNGVGILLSPVMKENVLEVNRESDSVIWMRLNVEKVEIHVVSAYAPPPRLAAVTKIRTISGSRWGK